MVALGHERSQVLFVGEIYHLIYRSHICLFCIHLLICNTEAAHWVRDSSWNAPVDMTAPQLSALRKEQAGPVPS